MVKKAVEEIKISYIDFLKNETLIKSFKLPELKNIARLHKLRISGTKNILVERIETYFRDTIKAVKIQAIFRGSLVRYADKLRGPAALLKNRSLCNNDTDFVTMEPLIEIEHCNFFSYADKQDFKYGFNISSLVQMIKKKDKLVNPYNREKIDPELIQKIIALYKISFMIYPTFKDEHEVYSTTHAPNVRTTRHYAARITPIIANELRPFNNVTTRESRTVINAANAIGIEQRLNILRAARAKPIERRMQDLFMEIDNLGNYTQSSWFTNLETRQYMRLYRTLYDIWNYRSHLSREVRYDICPFGNPFDNIFTTTMHINNLSFEDVQRACVSVIENLIYSGVDEENRRLGAFHALGGLTIVSPEARASIPWLHEYFVY
jgi:hypothetical protein